MLRSTTCYLPPIIVAIGTCRSTAGVVLLSISYSVMIGASGCFGFDLAITALMPSFRRCSRSR